MSKPVFEQLHNGIRLVYQKVHSPVAHLGFYFGTGSRTEGLHQMGLVHFLEHSLFKGTKKRKAFHVLSRIDSVGGELNAYTSKEELCIYASFTKKHFTRAIELLSDICIHSTFPTKEIAKEKEVVFDEINSYMDSPADKIFDDFEMYMFKDHPLGANILGTRESVSNITSSDLKDFLRAHFVKNNLVISYVGEESLEKLKKSIVLFLDEMPDKGLENTMEPFKASNTFHIQKNFSNFQSHCIVGGLAPGYKEETRIALSMLMNILGGPALNSILNLSVREKHGYAYTIEANYQSFQEIGYWQIYFGCDAKNLDLTIKLVHKALDNLCNEELSERQLHRYKEQLKGQIALSMDSSIGTMQGNAKSILMYNHVESIEDTFQTIDALSTKKLQEVARAYLPKEKRNTLIYDC